MTNELMTAVAADSLAGGHTTSAAPPTAQQAARFEAQLQVQTPPGSQYYEVSPTATVGLSDNWRVAINDLGHFAEQFRTQSDSLADPLHSDAISGGPGLSIETYLNVQTQICHLGFAAMNINLITSAERLVGENLRSLYQMT